MEPQPQLTTDCETWHVLIVDDEPDNLSLAADLLSLSGANTATAVDGVAGLETLKTFQPNLILLDLEMPQMDGWKMQQEVRALPQFNHVPIIALTALAMSTDAQRVESHGFDGYITKPFRVQTLLSQMSSVITQFQSKQIAKQNNSANPIDPSITQQQQQQQ